MKEDIQGELQSAHQATVSLKRLSDDARIALLKKIAAALVARADEVVTENKRDLDKMDRDDPRFDRLLLTKERVLALATAVLDVAKLADPAGVLLSSKRLENGLLILKKTVPLGVVGVIYESRPNVTIDVASLCLRSGNVCLLRGGTDAWHSNRILVDIVQGALVAAGLDKGMVQLLPTDRKFVAELLTATKYVDIIIPRGSQSLIEFVRENAKVPVIETGAGVCHTYVEQSADLDKAAKIVANAKISRPSVCNSLDTILVDEVVAFEFLRRLVPYFKVHAVEVLADERAQELLNRLAYEHVTLAEAKDFGREFLALQCSLKIVESFDEALRHIGNYSSKHSECIVSEDAEKITAFMESVDAAAVYANASTRFTDGAEFGLGAEIGISTQKLHARGPFALEKLVTEKWYITGEGQIR